jgi:hypothetical protein
LSEEHLPSPKPHAIVDDDLRLDSEINFIDDPNVFRTQFELAVWMLTNGTHPLTREAMGARIGQGKIPKVPK